MSGPFGAAGGTLTVERLNCTYLVSRDHLAPDSLRPRLDAVARDEIAVQCRAFLPALLDHDDPSVWFIRRLDVDVSLDVLTGADDLLARSWGRQIVQKLGEIVGDGPNAHNVVRFADRAAYLASFARELARGHVWDNWCYASLDGLRSLSTGRAVSEILTREPEWLDEVLHRLAREGALEEVLDQFTDTDAATVWAVFRNARQLVSPPRHVLDDLLAIWRTIHLREPWFSSAANALRVFVAARRSGSFNEVSADLSAAINILLQFADMAASTVSRERLIDALTSGDLRRTAALVHDSSEPDEMATVVQLLAAGNGDRAWFANAMRVVAPPTDGQDRVDYRPFGAADSSITAFGGVALLWPVFLNLQLDKLLLSFDRTNEHAALLRHLVASMCFGRARALAAARDPVLARMSGLDCPPASDALARGMLAVTQATSEKCLQFLVQQLSRLGRIQGRCLAADVLPMVFDGGDVLLLRDVPSDAWLYAAPVTADCGTLLQRGLALVAESAEVQAECLLIGPELDRLLAECAPVEWTPGLVLLRPGAAEPPAYRGALAEYRTHVRSALDDLTYLSLTGLPVLESQSPPYADLTLCLIARAMLRGLATRLLGFEWSSCAYLGRNFLSSVSTVQCAGGRITVHLARPPLHVILSLAGIDGHVHALPWLGDTTFTVSLADG